MKVNAGHWVIVIGLILLGNWLSLMPLYKYPASTDPFFAYLNSVIWLWFIAGPVFIVLGLVLAIVRHGSSKAPTPTKPPRTP